MKSDGKKLLVLDDDPGVVEFLCESLAEHGYRVRGETSARKALEEIQHQDFDLILTDVEMPQMRGIDLAAAILAEKPQQLVLLMTAFGSIELAVSAVQAGACDFIAKPFKIEALLFSIERAFRDRQMRREIVRLRTAISADAPGELVARSPAMKKAMDTARRGARSDSTVLLTGETGTGKTALAKFIHQVGARQSQPFIRVNCAALPNNLVESELFGVRRGAFTDAKENRSGAFVLAGRGTLFLDEIGELPLEGQAKLLHVLESGLMRPLGSESDVEVKARVIAATNQPLEQLLRNGQFRPDLYYRLNVIRIEVPPLRSRHEDIVPLVDLMLSRASLRQAAPIIGVSAAAMKRLLNYAWPGNVRELANLIERAVALTEHDTLVPEDLDFPKTETTADEPALNSSRLTDVQRAHVRRVVEENGGNKTAAARALGITRRTLYRKLEE